jgi:hypothetical protein
MRRQAVRLCVVTAVAVAVGTTAIAVARAPGDIKFTGETAEGVKVNLTVAESGNATVFKIGGTEVPCDQGSLSTNPTAFKRLKPSDPGEFSDKRKSSVEDGRFLLKDTFKTTGTFSEDDQTWSGTYSQKTKVLKNGDRVDSCELATTWSAT